MKTKQKSIKKIRKFLDEIMWLFQINNFNKNIFIAEKDKDSVFAEITYQENYQTIDLTIYPCFFKESLGEQKRVLLHELCHCITLPSKEAMTNLLNGNLVTEREIKAINETETSKIENILHSFLVGKLRYAREAYRNF